jgi:hypothetical protein
MKANDIKTVKHGNFLMLQYNGNTLQGVWKRSRKGRTLYESDTFGRWYTSMREAKEHTAAAFSDLIATLDGLHQ